MQFQKCWKYSAAQPSFRVKKKLPIQEEDLSFDLQCYRYIFYVSPEGRKNRMGSMQFGERNNKYRRSQRQQNKTELRKLYMITAAVQNINRCW